VNSINIMSENQTAKVGIVSAEDGSIKVVVFSAPESPPLLGAKASGAKNAPAEDVTVAESGASIKEFPVEEPAPPSTTHSGTTANPKTTTNATPKGSVSAFGWLSWPKLCWHNALCSVFICLIVVSAGGGAFAYFSHGSDNILPSIVLDATALPTERGPLFAPFNPTPDPVVPDPPNVVEDPNWLIATSGFCSNLNVVMKERDVKGKMTAGDMDGHFVADISFNYYPQTAVKFTDFPYHKANTIEGDQTEADALVSPAWDHKNIALLEPTSTCSADEQGRSNQSWAISVFKVEEHRACNDGETAWSGHPCVHYTGYVSAESPNFVNVNMERFVCQLFVDSVDDTVGSSPPKVSMLTAPMMTSEVTCADTSTDTDSEQRFREGLQERIDPKGRTIDQFLRGITSSNEDLLHISAYQFQLGEDIDTGEGLVVTTDPTANLFDRNKVAQSLGVSTASSFSSTKTISGDSIAEFSSQFAASASVGGSAWGVTASASASFSSSSSGSSKMSYAQLRSTQNVGVVTIHPGGDQKAYDAALADNTRKELEAVTGSTKAEAFCNLESSLPQPGGEASWRTASAMDADRYKQRESGDRCHQEREQQPILPAQPQRKRHERLHHSLRRERKVHRKVSPRAFQQPGEAHLFPRVCLLPRAEREGGGIHLAGVGAEQPQHVR